MNHDGLWDGGTVSDASLAGEIQFFVENNQVTEVAINYTLRSGGCTEITGFGARVDNAKTTSNDFTAQITNSYDKKQLIITGTFASATQASGTLEFKGTLAGCGDFVKNGKWTANTIPIPPTRTPTVPKPTAMATQPRATPTLPRSPTSQSLATPVKSVVPPTGGGNDGVVMAAIAKTKNAPTFRIDMRIQASSPSLNAIITPVPGSDSKLVDLLALKGERKMLDSHYVIGGVLIPTLASLLGFEANSTSIESTRVGGKTYVRGARAGTKEAQWYILPNDQATLLGTDSSNSFLEDLDLLQLDGLVKTGTENLDNHLCNVYSASGASAYYHIFPATTMGPTIDSFEIKTWVCDDGYSHQIRYDVSSHPQNQPNAKDIVTALYHIWDFDGAIIIPTPPNPSPLN